MLLDLRSLEEAAGIVGAGRIASAEAFGAGAVKAEVDPAGIASAEAFGSPVLEVPAAYDFRIYVALPPPPLPRLTVVQGAGGIESREAFGKPRIGASVTPIGIDGGGDVGLARVKRGVILADEEFLLAA